MEVEEYFRSKVAVPTVWMIDGGSRFAKMCRQLLTFDADNQERILNKREATARRNLTAHDTAAAPA